MTIKEELESQKENLERAGRIRTYLVISEIIWIAFATIVQVWQDIHNYGLIIAGVFATFAKMSLKLLVSILFASKALLKLSVYA